MVVFVKVVCTVVGEIGIPPVFILHLKLSENIIKLSSHALLAIVHSIFEVLLSDSIKLFVLAEDAFNLSVLTQPAKLTALWCAD